MSHGSFLSLNIFPITILPAYVQKIGRQAYDRNRNSQTFSFCGSYSCLAHTLETIILIDWANNWQDHQSFKIHVPQPKIAEPAATAVLGGKNCYCSWNIKIQSDSSKIQNESTSFIKLLLIKQQIFDEHIFVSLVIFIHSNIYLSIYTLIILFKHRTKQNAK